jgi:hypothetical protein
MLSQIESLIRTTLNYVFPNEKVIYNWRPDILKNPQTGRNLEIDIYYPDLNLAFEVNGIYHLTVCGRTRDSIKKKRCAENHINLFAITGAKEILKIIEQLKLFYPESLPVPSEGINAIKKYSSLKNKTMERLRARFTKKPKAKKKKKFKFKKIYC